MIVHKLIAKHIERFLQSFVLISSVSILLIVAGTVARNGAVIVQSGLIVIFLVLLHNLIGYGAGLWSEPCDGRQCHPSQIHHVSIRNEKYWPSDLVSQCPLCRHCCSRYPCRSRHGDPSNYRTNFSQSRGQERRRKV